MARVLIVEDHADQCKALTILLQQLGHRAIPVPSVEAALHHLLREPVDLLVTDIMMPGMDGMELLSMIRRAPATQSLPVIIYTALCDPDYQRYALLRGANDYWIKSRMDFASMTTRLAVILADATPLTPSPDCLFESPAPPA